jgi:hypothetical protein
LVLTIAFTVAFFNFTFEIVLIVYSVSRNGFVNWDRETNGFEPRIRLSLF